MSEVRMAGVVLAAKQIEWGDAASWFGGLSAFLAATAAIFLLYAQRRQLAMQHAQLVAIDDDRRKDQARYVSAWCIESRDTGLDEQTGAIMPADFFDVQVRFRNGSEEPIHRANVYVFSHWGEDPEVFRAWLDMLEPHCEGSTTVPACLERDLLTLPPVQMVFTDARGRHWRRTTRGVLEELPDNPDSGPC